MHSRQQPKSRVERANQTLQDRLVKEMRLAGINNIADYNRRFAVVPKDPHDAHLRYQGTAEELTRTLSVQVIKTLSKNLSCQHQGELIQVATSGTGLAMRGAAVTLHQHFDGTQELRWRKRKLGYTSMTKAPRQAAEADSKTVNERVDKMLAKRSQVNKGQKPAANHPWRNKPIGKSATEGHNVTQ